jgi:hypothetical protein
MWKSYPPHLWISVEREKIVRIVSIPRVAASVVYSRRNMTRATLVVAPYFLVFSRGY